MNNNKIIDDLARNPFLMSLSKEQYEMMSKDDDFKGNIFDFRDKLSSSNYSQNQIDYLIKRENQTELQKEFNELGGFVFCVYQRLSVMFDESILSLEDKSRILLLATYMGYDNKIKFKNNLAVMRCHLPIILRINDRSCKTFIKKVKDLNIIDIIDKEIYLNKELFVKGEIKNNKTIKSEDFGYIRVFANSYQYLYENIPKTKLKYLGILYNILGFINFNHNILVLENCNEDDISKIRPMTIEQMLTICGYKEGMTSQVRGRIRRAILDIKLINGMPLFAIVDSKYNSKILINPYVTYASSNIDTWNSTLEIIFKLKDKSVQINDK